MNTTKPVKPKYRTVYKVCRPGKLSVYETDYAIRYRRGVFTPPSVAGSKLFVFGRLRDARRFQATHKADRITTIWRCRARNCTPQTIRLPMFELDPRFEIAEFWEDVNDGRTPRSLVTHNTPRGTLVAESVKLLEVVR